MINNTGYYSTDRTMQINGLSTDEKPTVTYKYTKIENGSTFIEMDTGKVYMYDEENATWHEL